MRAWTPLVAGGIAAVLAGGAGCILQDPSYEGTAFACSMPDELCPPGYSCVEGLCQPTEPPGDPVDDGSPDAGVDDPRPPDAGADPAVDAAPDPDPVTLTFGERPGADHTGVTSDATMFSQSPNENDGDDDRFKADALPVEYGLLRFDVSAIPAGATVTSVELDLYVTNPIEDGSYELYPVLEDWDEDEVTFLDRRRNQRWTMPGAMAPASATSTIVATLAPRDDGPVQVSIQPSAVQAWVNNPSANAGLVWRANSPDRGGNFASSETGIPARAPLLTVTFVP